MSLREKGRSWLAIKASHTGDNHMKYDRWADWLATVARVRVRVYSVPWSCCDCPQNGTINVAYPFSQIVAQQKDARLQLLNTVNKCQCPIPEPKPRYYSIVDNIMTFRIIFQIVKKKILENTLLFFHSENQNWNCCVSWWCLLGKSLCQLVTAGHRATYSSFNYDFLLVFALSGKVFVVCLVLCSFGATPLKWSNNW